MTGRTLRRPPALLAAAGALAWVALWVMVDTGEGLAEDDGTVLRWLVGHRAPDLTLVLGAVVGAGALVVVRATTSVFARAPAVVVAGDVSAATGVSRLYLGDHWLTDVLASYALVGLVLGAVALLPDRYTGDGRERADDTGDALGDDQVGTGQAEHRRAARRRG